MSRESSPSGVKSVFTSPQITAQLCYHIVFHTLFVRSFGTNLHFTFEYIHTSAHKFSRFLTCSFSHSICVIFQFPISYFAFYFIAIFHTFLIWLHVVVLAMSSKEICRNESNLIAWHELQTNSNRQRYQQQGNNKANSRQQQQRRC